MAERRDNVIPAERLELARAVRAADRLGDECAPDSFEQRWMSCYGESLSDWQSRTARDIARWLSCLLHGDVR